jgi:tetratricopeptide (TPR) repeat protein
VALAEGEADRALKFLAAVPGVLEDRGDYRADLFRCYYAAGQTYLQLAGMHDAIAEDRRPAPSRAALASVPTFFGVPIDPAPAPGIPAPGSGSGAGTANRPRLDEVARGHVDAAMVLFDWLAGQTEGVNQILAAEGCAKALVLVGRYKDAIDAYEFAIHNLRVLASEESSDMPAPLRRLLDRLRAGQNAARRLRDIEIYSIEYVLFREAEVLRRERKDYAKAIEKYDAVILAAAKTMDELLKQRETQRLIDEARATEGQGTFFGIETSGEGGDAASAPGGVAGDHRAAPDVQPAAVPGESPFAAAATFHRALCLIELGHHGQGGQPDRAKLAQGIRALRHFVESDPGTKRILDAHGNQQPLNLLKDDDDDEAPLSIIDHPPTHTPPSALPGPGLYRGEALLELGRLALELELDLNRAETYFRGLDAWIAAVRKKEQGWDFANLLPGIREAAKKRTDGPKDEKFTDFWGNVKKTEIQPGQLVNRKTTPWYLDDIEEECAKFRGFIFMVRGDKDAALAQVRRLLRLDSEAIDGDLQFFPNDFTRLKFGAQHGYLIAYPDDLALYNECQRTAILYADFLFVTQHFAEAQARYESLLITNPSPRLRGHNDYLHYAISQCMYHRRVGEGSGRIAMLRELEKVFEHRDGTPAELRAALCYALKSREVVDPDIRARGDQILLDIAGLNKDHFLIYEARIALAFRLMGDGDFERADFRLSRVPASAGDRYKRARYLRTQLRDPDCDLWTWLGVDPPRDQLRRLPILDGDMK